MSRYYKTAKPTFVDDAIYQAPHELMWKALENREAMLEEDLKPGEGYEDLAADLEFTDKDEQEYGRLLKEQEAVMEDFKEKILDNPANYEDHRRGLAKARKEYEDLISSTGAVGKIDAQAKRKAKVTQDIEDRYQAGKIQSWQREQELKKLERDYTGFVNGGSYAEFSSSEKFVEPSTIASNLRNTIASNSTTSSVGKAQGDGYLKVVGSGNTYIKKERVAEIVENDQDFQQWERAAKERYMREFEEGNYETEQDAEEAFAASREEHKQSIIDKLAYNKSTYNESVGADQAYFQNERLEREEGLDLDSQYSQTVKYEGLSPNEIREITENPELSDREAGVQANLIRKDYTTVKERLEELARNEEDFIKDVSNHIKDGTTDFFETYGVTIEDAEKVANLIATQNQTFDAVGLNFEGTREEKKSYKKAVLNSIQNLKESTPVQYKVTVNGHTVESGTTSLVDLGPNGKGYLKGSSKQVPRKALVEKDGKFYDKDGKVLMVTREGEEEKVPASRVEALASSEAAWDETPETVPDQSKGLLSHVQHKDITETSRKKVKSGVRYKDEQYLSVDQRTQVEGTDGKTYTRVVTISVPAERSSENNAVTVKLN